MSILSVYIAKLIITDFHERWKMWNLLINQSKSAFLTYLITHNMLKFLEETELLTHKL